MDPSIIHTATLTALKDGKSLDEIYAFADQTNVDRSQVHDALHIIATDPEFSNASFASSISDFQQKGYMPQNNAVWDPFGKVPTDDTLNARNKHIQKRFEKWKKNPRRLKITYFSLLSIGIIYYACFLAFPWFRDMVNSWAFDLEEGGPLVYLGPWMPSIGYWVWVKRTQIDMVKRLVADKMGWKYDPSERKNRWTLSVSRYPELFSRGNQKQYIEDQFWGTYDEKPFWGGVFYYETETGSGKNRRVSKSTKHFFAFDVPQTIRERFLLKPQTKLASFFNFFSKRDIETESIAFNDAFEVVYPGEKQEEEQGIVATLSPSILARMAHAVEILGPYSVLFTEHEIVFYFHGRLFKKMKTSFILKGVYLDTRDEQWLETKLSTMMEIYTDIIPYLK